MPIPCYAATHCGAWKQGRKEKGKNSPGSDEYGHQDKDEDRLVQSAALSSPRSAVDNKAQ